MERTLVLLKPDCVQRRLMGRVIARLEDKGLNIVAMKLMRITPELARRHYAEHVQKAWYPELEAFITGGPLVAMIVEGPEAIRVVRDMAGATNGLNADPGTIRGDFSASQQMNLVHASDGPESADREIAIFFPRVDRRIPRPTGEGQGPAHSRDEERASRGPQPWIPGSDEGSERAITRRLQLPAGVSARSCSIMSRVAASTASCQRAAPNRSA